MSRSCQIPARIQPTKNKLNENAMKQIVASLIGLAVLAYSGAVSADDMLPLPGAYVFGRDYLKMSERERAIYVQGLADGYSFGSWQHIGPAKQKRAQFQRYLRCAEPVSSAFLKAAMEEYLRINPKAEVLPTPFAFGGAVQASCNK